LSREDHDEGCGENEDGRHSLRYYNG
jgi:hypothetical protein